MRQESNIDQTFFFLVRKTELSFNLSIVQKIMNIFDFLVNSEPSLVTYQFCIKSNALDYEMKPCS